MELLRGKSGIQILLRRMDTKLVDMRYIVRVGAVDEKPEEEGYCHALEHMLFAGTDSRSWQQVNRDWEKLGAWSNAFTALDRTGYHVTCLKQYWSDAFEVLTDIMYHPTFPEERWENVEKSTVISEIQAAHDNEDWYISEHAFRDALGPKYHSEIGDIDILRSARIKDLRKFYDRYYCGDNVTLVVTGDLTSQDLLRTVNKHDRLSNKTAPKRSRLVYDFNHRTLNLNQSLEQSVLYMCKPVYMPRTLRSRVGLEVGVECLQQYLFEELREKRGLCYEVSAVLERSLPNNVFLCIQTASEKKDFKRLEREMRVALSNFASEGLTSSRIENMKIHEIYNTITAQEDIASSPEWMWDAWEEHVYSDPFESHLGILEALSAGSIRRTMQKALTGKIKTTRMQSED